MQNRIHRLATHPVFCDNYCSADIQEPAFAPSGAGVNHADDAGDDGRGGIWLPERVERNPTRQQSIHPTLPGRVEAVLLHPTLTDCRNVLAVPF
jgi:hypothetical protein